MPIEIKELHIKINVSDTSNSKEKNEITKGNSDSKKANSEIIATCVETVLEILEEQKER